jgi:alanyl-tRNA synthetase
MTTYNTLTPSSVELTERYLAFFRTRGHHEIAGSPLVPSDNTTSFVIAGMQPLIPYLRGQMPPPAPRLTGWQRCLRSDDVDAVGTNARKCTSFHMLGNWSIGDYGRRGAVELALELLNELGVGRGRLWVTTFGGDQEQGLPPDGAIVAEWRRLGIPSGRIVPLGIDDNFWSTGGPGPCGPNSEIFVDFGSESGCGGADCKPGCSCNRFLEIWNLVFIEHERLPDGGYTPLPLRSVDTGMGLERIALVLQGVPTVFETDLFAGARRRLLELAPEDSASGPFVLRARRRIVDHTRAALLAGLAGVQPGPYGRGSVMRRLIRRAAREGRLLGLTEPFIGELAWPLAEDHGSLLTPEERARVPEVARMLADEERRFTRVLTAGLRELERLTPDGEGTVAGERLFALQADRGFPADLAAEVLAERGLDIEWSGYERALQRHREVSRLSAERRFRGA